MHVASGPDQDVALGVHARSEEHWTRVSAPTAPVPKKSLLIRHCFFSRWTNSISTASFRRGDSPITQALRR